MRVAVIADVHANAAALDAVLSAIERVAVDTVVCLGDMVGYNAEPVYCVERIRDEVELCVRGNHDEDVTRADPTLGTSTSARNVQQWTRAQLSEEHRDWLARQPNKLLINDEIVAVHGCYLNKSHISGYVTSTMLEANLKVIEEREDLPRIGLCGHTHVPLCAWLTDEGVEERKGVGVTEWPRDARAVLINPGSVGQPRDRDIRSAFAVVDTDRRTVSFERVSYDVARTVEAIERAELAPQLAARLWEGR
jgi:diadenosine tetraphosphatase ApaH/serine/threonine PP2A family protein phosphatase